MTSTIFTNRMTKLYSCWIEEMPREYQKAIKAVYKVKKKKKKITCLCCCSSVAKWCPTLCDPIGCSTTGLPVPHHLLELAQVHVHGISDSIQPSHPLLPSSSSFNLSQHQSLFQWVSSSHQMAKVLELQLKHHWSQWFIQSWFPLGLTSLTSLLSKGLSRVFSSTAIWKH